MVAAPNYKKNTAYLSRTIYRTIVKVICFSWPGFSLSCTFAGHDCVDLISLLY